MDLKSLSNLTKVVIVDNNDEEGEAVQKALDQNGVASHFHYFKDKTKLGDVKRFPNVRLVFLDLELDTLTRDVKIKANTTLSCLERIVEPSSYYVLVVWSGELNTELSRRFLRILKTQGKEFRPSIEPILLNKKDFRNRDGTFKYKQLKQGIDAKLKQVDFFKLFTEWEQQINDVSSKLLRDLLGTETKESISKKVNSLAEAYAGQYATKNPSLFAMLTLDGALKGALDSGVIKNVKFKESNASIVKSVQVKDIEEKARINRLLMVNEDGELGPGCVFKVDTKSLDGLLKSIVSNTTLENGRGIVKVKIDITPLCDYAQRNKTTFYHFVYGLMAPASVIKKAISNKNKEGRLANKLPSAYELWNFFNVDGKPWILIVDLSASESLPVKIKSGLPKKSDIWFKVRDGIVIDLQHKVSTHSSRPGHTLLT